MAVQLIADSGSTKCEWGLLYNGKKKIINTQGISPYFVKREQIVAILEHELLPELKNVEVEELYFYGTGLTNPTNEKVVRLALKEVFSGVEIIVWKGKRDSLHFGHRGKLLLLQRKKDCKKQSGLGIYFG
jgi:glucosamine kinase